MSLRTRSRSMQSQGASLTGASRNRTPLVELLPQYITRRAWFTEIATAGGPTIATGHSAWYGLRRIDVAGAIGEDLGLFGTRFEMLPCNTNGAVAASAGTAGSWGDAKGNKAAIVVGKNLPITLNAWSSAKAFIPGVEWATAGTAGLLVEDQEGPEILGSRGFPPGTLNDTAPQRHVDPIVSAPWVSPFRESDFLDVALVVNKAQFDTMKGSSHIVVGFAHMTLFLGRAYSKVEAR